MNAATAIHLARTEFVRNRWLILAIWLLALVPLANYLIAPLAALLVSRFALELHPGRVTAHWRMRPVSKKHWMQALLLAVGSLIAPAVLLQTFVGRHFGFDAGALTYAAAEVVLLTSVFFCAVFAIAIVAGSGPKTVALMLALLVVTALISAIHSALPFAGSTTEDREGYLLSPNPVVWWVAWPILLLLLAAIIFHYVKANRPRVSILLLVLLTGVALFAFGWVAQHEVRSQKIAIDFALKLIETATDFPNTDGQRIHSDVAITDLPAGAYVEVQHWIVPGGSPIDSWQYSKLNNAWKVHSKFALDALANALPADHRVYGQPECLSPALPREQPIDPTQPLRQSDGTPPENPLRLSGSLYRWTELGEIPIREQSLRLAEDTSLSLRPVPPQDRQNRHRVFDISLIRPNLALSPSATENPPHPHSSFDRLALVLSNNKLRESIVVFLRTTGDSRQTDQPGQTVFGQLRHDSERSFVNADPDWRLLYPHGDLLEQWLENASLKVFTAHYQGGFHADLTLDPAQARH